MPLLLPLQSDYGSILRSINQRNYSVFSTGLLCVYDGLVVYFSCSLLFLYQAVKGLVPTIPKVEGAIILLAAFVGTTMASATFVSRPLFIQGKGWTVSAQKTKTDAMVAALLIFLISGSIMAWLAAVYTVKALR